MNNKFIVDNIVFNTSERKNLKLLFTKIGDLIIRFFFADLFSYDKNKNQWLTKQFYLYFQNKIPVSSDFLCKLNKLNAENPESIFKIDSELLDTTFKEAESILKNRSTSLTSCFSNFKKIIEALDCIKVFYVLNETFTIKGNRFIYKVYNLLSQPAWGNLKIDNIETPVLFPFDKTIIFQEYMKKSRIISPLIDYLYCPYCKTYIPVKLQKFTSTGCVFKGFTCTHTFLNNEPIQSSKFNLNCPSGFYISRTYTPTRLRENDNFNLIVKTKSNLDKNLSLKFEQPLLDNFELVEGNLSHTHKLSPFSSFEFEAIIKAKNKGNFYFNEGKLQIEIDKNNKINLPLTGFNLYIDSSEDKNPKLVANLIKTSVSVLLEEAFFVAVEVENLSDAIAYNVKLTYEEDEISFIKYGNKSVEFVLPGHSRKIVGFNIAFRKPGVYSLNPFNLTYKNSDGFDLRAGEIQSFEVEIKKDPFEKFKNVLKQSLEDEVLGEDEIKKLTQLMNEKGISKIEAEDLIRLAKFKFIYNELASKYEVELQNRTIKFNLSSLPLFEIKFELRRIYLLTRSCGKQKLPCFAEINHDEEVFDIRIDFDNINSKHELLEFIEEIEKLFINSKEKIKIIANFCEKLCKTLLMDPLSDIKETVSDKGFHIELQRNNILKSIAGIIPEEIPSLILLIEPLNSSNELKQEINNLYSSDWYEKSKADNKFRVSEYGSFVSVTDAPLTTAGLATLIDKTEMFLRKLQILNFAIENNTKTFSLLNALDNTFYTVKPVFKKKNICYTIEDITLTIKIQDSTPVVFVPFPYSSIPSQFSSKEISSNLTLIYIKSEDTIKELSNFINNIVISKNSNPLETFKETLRKYLSDEVLDNKERQLLRNMVISLNIPVNKAIRIKRAVIFEKLQQKILRLPKVVWETKRSPENKKSSIILKVLDEKFSIIEITPSEITLYFLTDPYFKDYRDILTPVKQGKISWYAVAIDRLNDIKYAEDLIKQSYAVGIYVHVLKKIMKAKEKVKLKTAFQAILEKLPSDIKTGLTIRLKHHKDKISDFNEIAL